MLGALLLLALLPLFAVIALAIKLDSPGPVFFRQRRYGFNNNAIVVWKFRTMHHKPEDESVVPQATRNDPRVTRIGRMLRRSSLDEMRQRVQHDLFYIDNWSFWFDLKILALTPFAAINRNAY